MMPRLVIGLPVLPLYSCCARSDRYCPRPTQVRRAAAALTIASLAARSGAATLVAIEPELFVEDVFHRKARRLVLALEIGLHLLALFVLLDRLDREPDAALAAVDLHHDRFEFVVHLEQRGRFVDPLVAELRDVDQAL